MRIGLLALLAIGFCSGAQAHSGGTDAYGCHNQTSTGTYHCHSGTYAGQTFTSKSSMLAKLGSSNTTATTTTATSTETTNSVYNRDDYLPSWADADRDCQDTRDEVLIAESLTPVVLDAARCNVVSGRWYDPYTGLTFTNPSDLDIDHVVALSEVHKSGGYLWTTTQKRAYANDLTNPLVLIAVDDGTNSSKGDKDPAQWLPPNRSYWCEYIKNWVSIKKSYSLSVDADEQTIIDQFLPAGNQPDRTKATTSWSARKGGTEAGATFGVGLGKANSCGFQQSAKVADPVVITLEVLPAANHIGQTGNLYLVDRVNGEWLMEQEDGSFIPWDSQISSLMPVKRGVTLQASVVSEIFSGRLSTAGQHQIYVGYSTGDGELIYTPIPVAIDISP
jgi:hypothetical protein